ncbi:MAG: Sulfite reductase [NADPH] flavoprotein alpha-component [Chlamydiales bacterium]|nr:Sulfite reductase [NADPH] flavoprotein alpha-component [Chlamydiales bacterium]MCH9619317.1 Sulfite reductase [NADPH] flavoprotein alpha-component [Chlamydiales bacterium]MCH9622579.1 Sulfite reductase [NADPH] flavoprotein alpha-component [Chlamydiales bacterium]
MPTKPSAYVSIKKREKLTKEGSEKETFHLTLDLEQAKIDYAVGDCIAIYPQNDPQLVASILSHFSESPDTLVNEENTFEQFLLHHANLIRAPKALYQKLGVEKTDYLIALLPCSISAKEFCSHLSPILPRFYSIASSMHEVGKSADLTVTVNPNPDGFPIPFGTCSHFLCHRAPLDQPIIPIYHHTSSHFHLPKESYDKPIIMVGPGTGIAPFRGFMQERVARNGCSENWIFFGEQREAFDFYYKDEWQKYIEMNQLRFDTAFSRDGKEKIYVQDRMLENQEEIWKWLEKGAYFFVCGDAKKMARDVDLTLKQIIQNHTNIDPKDYIKKLKSEKRYLRDVY